MKKILILSMGLLMAHGVFAQKMMTKTGVVKFEAIVPAFEPVAATNNTVSCILDQSTGEIAALALIKSFKFKVPLMEEHFNENYMESSKYPKATFKGVIQKLDVTKLTSEKVPYDLEGDLTIRGVSKKIKTKIMLSKSDQKIQAVSNFSVKPQDFNIEIPAVVRQKIAEDVNINIDFLLEQK